MPEAFAANGEAYYCVVKTSGDVAVGEPFNIEALGEDATDNLTRTFTSSRWKVYSGEVETGNDGTLIEYGSASPDNTGGYVKESGWAGTQGDKKIVDFAAVEMTGTLDVTGAVTTSSTLNTGSTITENAKKLPGVVYETTTPAAAAGIVIALTESPANVRAWLIEGIDVTMSATASVTVTISYDNGATYKGGPSDYGYVSRLTTTGASAGILNDDANANGVIAISTQTPANKLGRLNMTVTTVETSNAATVIEGRLNAYDNSSTALPLMADFGIWGLGSYGRATHIKISVSSGTITGTFRVIPQRGFGE